MTAAPVDFDAIRAKLKDELRWRRRACRLLTFGRHAYRRSWRVDIGAPGFAESDETFRGWIRQCRICGECEVVPRS